MSTPEFRSKVRDKLLNTKRRTHEKTYHYRCITDDEENEDMINVENVVEINIRTFDKHGYECRDVDEDGSWRVSVYFNNRKDSHHFQIPLRSNKMTVAKAFYDLAKAIKN